MREPYEISIVKKCYNENSLLQVKISEEKNICECIVKTHIDQQSSGKKIVNYPKRDLAVNTRESGLWL